MEDSNFIKELEPAQISEPELNGSVLPERKKLSKGIASRSRSFIFRILIILYMLGIVASGYWYWARPVRDEQLHNAYAWWTEIAGNYGLPVPSADRWD